MATDVDLHGPADERTWLVRAVVILQSPTTVFEALRDDRDEVAHAREEAALALIFVAGIGGVLWTPVAGTVMDDPLYDGVLIAVWAFIAGGLYGAVVYWAGALLLLGGSRVAGGRGSYRSARHVLAFAAAPIALSLILVFPVRLAVYGSDIFRTGGADHGTGDAVFVALELLFLAWSVALLVLGLRTVNRWSWGRALGACAAAAALPALVVLASRGF